MQWTATAITDQGRVRPTNEDSYLLRPELGLFAVADGMGGHAAGEVASGIAISTVDERLAASLPSTTTADELEEALRTAVDEARTAILRRARIEPEKAGMGTTLVLLAIRADGLFRIAHVGDSRAYLLRRGELLQLTTDHTQAQELVESGHLTPREAHTHRLGHILTRALGATDPEVEPDIVGGAATPGDLLLLCSDGLTGMVDDEDLHAILSADAPLESLADRLVEAANLRGGYDNITAVLIRVAA